ncbi:unnamed protein product, partial [Closterium sp. NIES-54]
CRVGLLWVREQRVSGEFLFGGAGAGGRGDDSFPQPMDDPSCPFHLPLYRILLRRACSHFIFLFIGSSSLYLSFSSAPSHLTGSLDAASPPAIRRSLSTAVQPVDGPPCPCHLLPHPILLDVSLSLAPSPITSPLISQWSDFPARIILPLIQSSSFNFPSPLPHPPSQALSTLLPKLKSDGHRVLLFSQWTAVLDILQHVMGLLGLTFLRLDGR